MGHTLHYFTIGMGMAAQIGFSGRKFSTVPVLNKVEYASTAPSLGCADVYP